VWQVDEAATSNRPHVWQVALLDGAGRRVYEGAGLDHVPSALRGQRIISWFSIDPAQDQAIVLPVGSYQLVVQLVDAWTPAVVGQPLQVGSVDIGPPIRCGV
jgi:hypothetical protein